jgi:hypothetical protein
MPQEAYERKLERKPVTTPSLTKEKWTGLWHKGAHPRLGQKGVVVKERLL